MGIGWSIVTGKYGHDVTGKEPVTTARGCHMKFKVY